MLSIIVPVYNVKKYLLECLHSLEKQTYKDCEIIVVDDGSTDGSGDAVDFFCAGQERFKVYHKKNGGLMSAWMYGVEHSTGEYIGFVDSDDAVEINMYERMMKVAHDTDADIVMCGRRDITKTTSLVSLDDTMKPFYAEMSMKEIHDHVFPSLMGGNVSSARWNKVFKREIFIPNMKYCVDQSRYCEDRYIVPACLLTANSFAFINEPLYIYRVRSTANSKSPSPELVPSLERLYQIQVRMLKDKGLYNKYSRHLEIAKINYMKIAFDRNLVNSKGLALQKKVVKQILTKENREIVLRNRTECVYKFGKTLYAAAKLNCSYILLLGALLNRIMLRHTKTDWFD